MRDSRYGDATPALYRGGLPIGADTLHPAGLSLLKCYGLKRRNGVVSTIYGTYLVRLLNYRFHTYLFSSAANILMEKNIVLDSTSASCSFYELPRGEP